MQTTEHTEEPPQTNILDSAGSSELLSLDRISVDSKSSSNFSPPLVPAVSSGLHTPPYTQNSGGIATPGVRHLIKGLNLDITNIQGTGRDGRVRKEDVQKYMALQQSKSVPTNTTQLSHPTLSKPLREAERVSLTSIQNQMFKTMTHSLTIPHFLYTHAVDVTTLNKLRKKLKSRRTLLTSVASTSSSSAVTRLTALPFIMKALSLAFEEFPQINAHLDIKTDPNKPAMLHHSSHNFGLAIDTPQGLMVPVIRNVQNHSIMTLTDEVNRMSKLANEGKLAPDDLKGATFTVSNIGSIGGGVVSPVIVPPMVGILGVGRIRMVPAVKGDEEEGENEWELREEVVLSWSADHRVLDGATVARCAELVGRLIQNCDLMGLSLR